MMSRDEDSSTRVWDEEDAREFIASLEALKPQPYSIRQTLLIRWHVIMQVGIRSRVPRQFGGGVWTRAIQGDGFQALYWDNLSSRQFEIDLGTLGDRYAQESRLALLFEAPDVPAFELDGDARLATLIGESDAYLMPASLTKWISVHTHEPQYGPYLLNLSAEAQASVSIDHDPIGSEQIPIHTAIVSESRFLVGPLNEIPLLQAKIDLFDVIASNMRNPLLFTGGIFSKDGRFKYLYWRFIEKDAKVATERDLIERMLSEGVVRIVFEEPVSRGYLARPTPALTRSLVGAGAYVLPENSDAWAIVFPHDPEIGPYLLQNMWYESDMIH